MISLLLFVVACGDDVYCPEVLYEPIGPSIEREDLAAGCPEGECSTHCLLPACTEDVLTCEECVRVEAWAEEHCPSCVERAGATNLDYQIGCGSLD